MALVPCRRKVLSADGRFMEWLDLRSRVGVRKSHGRIKATDGLRVGDAESREAAGTIGAQLSEVHVERAIFLQQEKDVFDDACRRGSDGYGCRLGDHTAIRLGRTRCVSSRGCGGDCSGPLRSRTRSTHGMTSAVDDRECGWRAPGDLP